MAEKKKQKIKAPYDRGRERGFREGFIEGKKHGFEYVVLLFMAVARDKFDIPGERIQEFWIQFLKYKTFIVTPQDLNELKKSIRQEYGITFSWTTDEEQDRRLKELERLKEEPK